MKVAALALLAGALLALAGCGGGGGGSTSSPTSFTVTTNPRAEKPPKGSSPVLREIYRQFYPPEADPTVKGSAKAIKKGERICKGKTPAEIKEEFIAEADLLPSQREAVAELDKYEKREGRDASFVAGQLAALVYEKSLPEDARAMFGYQGCIYALSQKLKRQLAPNR